MEIEILVDIEVFENFTGYVAPVDDVSIDVPSQTKSI